MIKPDSKQFEALTHALSSWQWSYCSSLSPQREVNAYYRTMETWQEDGGPFPECWSDFNSYIQPSFMINWPDSSVTVFTDRRSHAAAYTVGVRIGSALHAQYKRSLTQDDIKHKYLFTNPSPSQEYYNQDDQEIVCNKMNDSQWPQTLPSGGLWHTYSRFIVYCEKLGDRIAHQVYVFDSQNHNLSYDYQTRRENPLTNPQWRIIYLQYLTRVRLASESTRPQRFQNLWRQANFNQSDAR